MAWGGGRGRCDIVIYNKNELREYESSEEARGVGVNQSREKS